MKTWDEITPRHRSSYRPCATCGQPCAKHAEFCRACSPNHARGENHYAWKGDEARAETKRQRAALLVDIAPVLGECESCGEPAKDRHHKDGDPGNNVPENIAVLCRRCHMRADGRLTSRDKLGRFA